MSFPATTFDFERNDDSETNQTTATAMAKQALRPQAVNTRLSHLLSHWPSDPVRPASVSVQTYLQSRGAQLPQDQQQGQPQQNVAGDVTAQTAGISEANLDALSSLLEDRFARRFPLSPKLRHPASNPEHYDNVVREFQEAPSRDWMGRLKKRLSGLFRVS